MSSRQSHHRLDQLVATNDDGQNSVLAWEWRMVAVSLVGLIPGIQLGCILGVMFLYKSSDLYWMIALGGILGMIVFGKLEAHDGH